MCQTEATVTFQAGEFRGEAGDCARSRCWATDDFAASYGRRQRDQMTQRDLSISDVRRVMSCFLRYESLSGTIGSC